MKGFIKVTISENNREHNQKGQTLIPVDNIESVGELGSEKSEPYISFKIGRAGFDVLESFEEICAQIEEATKDKFIKITVADGCKVLIPVENIEYVTELESYEYSKTFISFKVGRAGFNVRESFDEISARIEKATQAKEKK